MTPGEVVGTLEMGALVADRFGTLMRCFAEREFQMGWVKQEATQLRLALDEDRAASGIVGYGQR